MSPAHRPLSPFTLLLSLFFLFPSAAWAFPELTRHGYTNCTSCHVSPTGGGTLSNYGRQLSREILSTWSKEGEERPAWVINQPEPLQLGGDYRGVYVYRDTPTFRDGRYVQMQADVEAAYTLGKFTGDASFGYDSFNSEFLSRRFFLLYHLSDEWSLRAGKYLFAYGINTPNHIRLVRRALPLNDEGMETPNVELSYLSENWSGFLTAVLGRVGRGTANLATQETGVAFSGDRHFGDRIKAGLSYYYAQSEEGHRNVFGPYGILGFTEKLYLLTEWDFQQRAVDAAGASDWGGVVTNQLGYELIQGLNVYVAQDYARLKFTDSTSVVQDIGPGLQWYPRPHFEFELSWLKQRTASVSQDWIDYAYVMAHFYL